MFILTVWTIRSMVWIANCGFHLCKLTQASTTSPQMMMMIIILVEIEHYFLDFLKLLKTSEGAIFSPWAHPNQPGPHPHDTNSCHVLFSLIFFHV